MTADGVELVTTSARNEAKKGIDTWLCAAVFGR
jgi:hypothetical protein